MHDEADIMGKYLLICQKKVYYLSAMVPFSTITRNLLLFVVEHISFYVGIFLELYLDVDKMPIYKST